MDVMKEFENYLPKWSEEKMQPIPTRKHMDKWNIAWRDFIKEYMQPRWHELAEEYRSMQFKTSDYIEPLPEVEEEPEPEVIVEEEQLSEWEKVQKFLK